MSTDKQKKSDPDNVFVTPGKQDTSKVYVFIPFNYRDAQAALKEAGATWAGSQWELGKDAFAAAEEKIRDGAKADIALGADGRKTREDGLKAAKEGAKAETKAASAEAAAAKVAEADKTRIVVKAGSVEKGAEIEVNGTAVTVTEISREWEVKASHVADYKTRFGIDVKEGDKVAYAKFEEPSNELAGPN